MHEEIRTEFDYLLNRFELASQADEPAKHGYGEHRRALYAYVRKLEAATADRDRLEAEVEALKEEFNEVLADWNALRSAVGSPTNGGALGHAAAIRKDAERYRWLRAAWLADPDAGEDTAWSPIMHSCDEAEMDADIDAAIDQGVKHG